MDKSPYKLTSAENRHEENKLVHTQLMDGKTSPNMFYQNFPIIKQ